MQILNIRIQDNKEIQILQSQFEVMTKSYSLIQTTQNDQTCKIMTIESDLSAV